MNTINAIIASANKILEATDSPGFDPGPGIGPGLLSM
jgi:hypothetical protein